MRKQILLFLILSLGCATHVARAVDRVIVEDFDERPVSVKAYPPAYPPDMLKASVSGLVNVSVVIDEGGAVVEYTVAKSSRAEFERPALDAVRKWKFKPARKGGVPVVARMILQITFKPDA